MAQADRLATMMRFNFLAAALILAEVALATSAQNLFQANRDAILAGTTTVVGDAVFSVGRAKSSRLAGDDTGFSKAALFAYGNLDRLNFERADWPEDVEDAEKGAVWKAYRGKVPFALSMEGGTRIYREKTQDECFLMVMAFPKAQVLMPQTTAAALRPFINGCRQRQGSNAHVLPQEAGANLETNCGSGGDETQKLNPVGGTQIVPAALAPTMQKTESLDEDLML